MDEQDIQKAKDITKNAVQSAVKKVPTRIIVIIAAILLVFAFF